MSAVIEFGFNSQPVFSGVEKINAALGVMDQKVRQSQSNFLTAAEAEGAEIKRLIAASQRLTEQRRLAAEASRRKPLLSGGVERERADLAAEAAQRQKNAEAQKKAAAEAAAVMASQQRAAEAAAATQQKLAAIHAAAQSKAMAAAAAAATVAAAEQRSAALKTNNGRMNLALLEAQIGGNKKEAASIQNRISLMERMRTIQSQTNVSQREAYVLAQRSSGLATMGGRGGRNMNIGMASMQMQDIAVQMQMGTRMSTIIAQQGSQLLSIFGPGGMIVGGLVAVGGMFYSMQEKGVEALKALKEEALGFDKSLRHLKVGGIMEMIDGMEQMKTKANSLRANHAADNQSAGGLLGNSWASLKRFASPSRFENGKWINNYDEKRSVETDLAGKNEQGRKELMDQIVRTAAEELRIAQMRAAGRDAEADKLEREVALRRELSKLDSAPEEIRGKLQDNVRAKFGAEQQKAAADAAKAKQAEMDKLAAAQQRLDEQKKDAALDQMTLAQRIAVMSVDAQKALAEENRLKGAAKLDAQAIIDAESRRVGVQAQILNSQRQLATEKEREAEAAKRAAEQAARQAEQAAAAASTRRSAVMDTALEFKMLEAKAAGRKKEVEEIEKQQRIMDRARRLEEQNSLGKREALGLAIKMTDMEDRANGKRRKIRGVQTTDLDPDNRLGLSGRNGPLSSRSGPLSNGGPLSKHGGLEGFWNLQLGNQGSSRLPSQYAGLNAFSTSPSLQATHQANAAAAAAPASGGPSVDVFLEKLIQRLPPALAAAILADT